MTEPEANRPSGGDTPPAPSWLSLMSRIRERKLVQWTLGYAAGAFALLQVLDIVGNRFDWPDVLLRAAIVLLAAGLLLTLVGAWYHGERGRQRIGAVEALMIGLIAAGAAAGVALVLTRSQSDAAAAGPLAVAGILPVPAPQSSIAVLPFANVSGDSDHEPFSDGLTDELISALSRVQGLKVAARTSAFQYKGVSADARDVGRRLGVAAVLEGSVRVAGPRLRVAAQLVGTRDGYQLWSEVYERELSDVFAIQDDIARAIVAALRVRLGPGAPVATHAPTEFEAYELYLRGRFFANRRSEEALDRAAAYFQQAIALAPDYARAHAGLAHAYISPRRSRPDERFRAGRLHALRALELDGTLAEAHTAMAWIHMWYDRDWASAERALETAISLDPSHIWAHQWYAAFLGAVGRRDDALHAMRRALSLDPLSLAAMVHVGTNFLWFHRFEEALAQYQSALDLDPGFAMARGGLGRALLALGRHDEAVAELRHPGADYVGFQQQALLGHALGIAGRTDEARAVLAGLLADAESGYIMPANIAIVHIGLGDHDAALDWLERVEADRGAMVYLAADPLYDPLRGSPRFDGLLRRLGVPHR